MVLPASSNESRTDASYPSYYRQWLVQALPDDILLSAYFYHALVNINRTAEGKLQSDH